MSKRRRNALMSNRRVKTRAGKKPVSRKKRRVDPAELVIPVPRQSLDALQAESPGREPSPEELLALELSVEREQTRQGNLGLAREYPRTDRPLVKPLTDALKAVPGLKAVHARVVAQSLKQLVDRAHDLDQIVNRILHQKHSPSEIAELVMAFQIVTEQLSSYAEMMGDKLYDLFDRAKGLK
jgi:hypothetical protein